MKTVIISGSSRKGGNTEAMVEHLQTKIVSDHIDLLDYKIGHYDYKYGQNDDFLPLVTRVIADYDRIIFATPVYWYTMSGLMKVFFDRLSDLIRVEKDTGRKLRGKSMAALCCGSEDNFPNGFFEPFVLSANYLGMNYIGDVRTWSDNGEINKVVEQRLTEFALKLKA